MLRIKRLALFFAATFTLTACGGGGSDDGDGVGQDVLTDPNIANVNAAPEQAGGAEALTEFYASKGYAALDCSSTDSTFEGCFSTECIVTVPGVSSTRVIYEVTGEVFRSTRVAYIGETCSSVIDNLFSNVRSIWGYQYESISDNRAVVVGEPLALIDNLGRDTRFDLSYDRGFALWESRNNGNTLCLSNGATNVSAPMLFSEKISEVGTEISGSCGTRFTL